MQNLLFNRSVLSNPYPAYAQLREAAAVHYVEPVLQAHLITRYEDIGPILKNTALYSSRGMDFSQRTTERINARTRELMNVEHSLLASDPPIHTRLRQLISRAFTPRRVAELEPRIREIAREHIEPLLSQDTPELVQGLTAVLPVVVIAEMLGVEPERRHDFRRWSEDTINASSLALQETEPARLEASIHAMHDYLQRAIEERRHAPRNDLISALVEAGDKEDFITPRDLIHFCRLLLVAGNETTTNLMGNALVAFVRHPSEWERLVDKPSLLPQALEEVLRYDSPVQALLRECTQETRVAGHPMPAGARVMLLLGSANHDPRRFEDPERFDITRDAQGHYSFGHGPHFCLGAPLARLEARVVFEELLERVRRFEFASGQEEALEWGNSLFLRGPRVLRLRAELRA